MRERPPELVHLPGPSGTRLVAVPGLGLTVEAPLRALRPLQAVAASTALALPGYGAPAAPDTALEPPGLAAALLDRLGALDVGRAVLLGHSASCQVVAEAARAAPDRVAGLVLLGPTTDPRAAAWPPLVARWLRTAVWERPGQLPLLVRAYAHTGLGGMRRAMDLARRHRIDAALAAVRCPTLILRGRHDRIAPRDWVDALAGCCPGARAETLAAGGHMIPVTHPGLTAGRIGRFLSCAGG
jgi:pimeloyl-ACP methyl ester carboxylesterase